MKIKSLHIKNFKSLVDLEIVEPNPFTVFVGANGVGKSNIFEALEFVKANITYADLSTKIDPERLKDVSVLGVQTDLIDFIEDEFGGKGSFLNFKTGSVFDYSCSYVGSNSTLTVDYGQNPTSYFANIPVNPTTNDLSAYKQFYDNFSRVFIGKENLFRLKGLKSRHLSRRVFTSGSNLEKVFKRLLEDPLKREEIVEYLQLLIPEFKDIEIHSDNIGGADSLLIYESGSEKPFTKDLISDGTFNILCLLTAIFQSDEPQFLCIEEPENGLTPYVIEALIELIRSKCKENGHYIWLNTHSQTLVRHLKEEELILVDKVDGATKVKQFKKGDFYGLSADEAWLTNALGAGLPW